MNVIIKNQSVKLGKPFAEGGEAEIYKIDNGLNVLKLFKTPDHPTYAHDPMQQQGARMRAQEYQLKLKSFPPHLPNNVIAPRQLAFDNKGMVIGYVMPFIQNAFPLIQYSDKMFREQSGVNEQQVLSIFHHLQDAIIALHKNQIIVGDLNDLNVLVKDDQAYLIDTDSYQFGKFISHTFTQTFLDPKIAKEYNGQLMMSVPYQSSSDWYAYAVMLMQSLLYVGPYGGIYHPKDPQKKVAQALRSLQRITIFDKEVRYPKAAIPYNYLSDDLLHWFWNVFTKDLREPLPERFFSELQWHTCPKCHIRHARHRCPVCDEMVPGIVKQTIKVDGNLIVSKLFETPGVVLVSKIQNGKLLWLVYNQGEYHRENKMLVAKGTLSPTTRYAIHNTSTLIANSSQLKIHATTSSQHVCVDTYENIPVMAANSKHYYWVQSGELMKDGVYGPERIATVLADRTFVWVGETFGFGLSREAMYQLVFVFNAETKGILEVKNFPKFPGRIVDTAVSFTDTLCWYFYKMEDHGVYTTGCVVVDNQANVIATIKPDVTDAWIQNIHGKAAVGNYLFSATDEGIMRLTLDHGQIVDTKLFTNTEHLVDMNSRLLVGDGGIYVINVHNISHIKFA